MKKRAKVGLISLGILLVLTSLFVILILPLIRAPSSWTKNETSVWVDDENVYISVSPHTIYSSEWVYFSLVSKKDVEKIDILFGFDTDIAKPKKAELYAPYYKMWNSSHSKFLFNVTNYNNTGFSCDFGNEYNKFKKNISYYLIEKNNLTEEITYTPTSNIFCFDSYSQEGKNYTVYWHTQHQKLIDWKDFSAFESINYEYGGMNKWYYLKDISIQKDKNYLLRGYIEVLPRFANDYGKYWLAIKPSSETLQEAISNGHLYYLDPWYNSSWDKKKQINITEKSGSDLTNYVIKLEIDYDSDMINNFSDLRFLNSSETGTLDYWLENINNGVNVTAWVEIPAISANDNLSIYMYYANSLASSESSLSSIANTTTNWTVLNNSVNVRANIRLRTDEDIIVSYSGAFNENNNMDFKKFNHTNGDILIITNITRPDRLDMDLGDYIYHGGLATNTAYRENPDLTANCSIADASDDFQYTTVFVLNTTDWFAAGGCGTSTNQGSQVKRLNITCGEIWHNATHYGDGKDYYSLAGDFDENSNFYRTGNDDNLSIGSIGRILGHNFTTGNVFLNLNFSYLSDSQVHGLIVENSTSFYLVVKWNVTGTQINTFQHIDNLGSISCQNNFTGGDDWDEIEQIGESFYISADESDGAYLKVFDKKCNLIGNVIVGEGMDSLSAQQPIVFGNHLTLYSVYRNQSNITQTILRRQNLMGYTKTEPTYLISAEIDEIVPKVYIVSPTNTTYSNATIYFNITTSENLSWANFTLLGYNYSLVAFNSTYYYAINVTIPDGSYSINFNVSDPVGNINDTERIVFSLDTTYPQVKIITPTNTTYNVNISNLNYTYTDMNPGFCWYDRGGANSTSVAAGINWSNVVSVEGNNTYILYCNDTANNLNSTLINFFVDTIQPAIAIVYPVNNTWYNINISTLNWTVSDANLQTCLWSRDGWATNTTIICGTNKSDIVSVEGNNTYLVWANDTSGNANSTAVKFWKDTVQPVIAIVYPSNITYNINISALNYTYIDLNPSSCWYSRDRGAVNSTAITAGLNFTGITSIEASNNWTLYCNDSVNNLNSTFLYFWKDTIAPYYNIISPTNTTYTNATIYFNISSTEELSYCVYTINTWANNYSLTMKNISYYYAVNTSVLDGSFTARFWCNDTSGNINTTSVVFNIDVTLPDIQIIEPINSTYYSLYSINISLNVSINYSDITGYWWSHNEGQNNYSFTPNTTMSWDQPSETTYVYNVTVWVNDTHNNVAYNISMITIEIVNPGGGGGGGGGGGSSVVTPSEPESPVTPSEPTIEDTVSESTIGEGFEGTYSSGSRINTPAGAIEVRGVTSSGATFTIPNTQETITIPIGETRNVDLSGDNFEDVYITVEEIENGKVILLIKSLHRCGNKVCEKDDGETVWNCPQDCGVNVDDMLLNCLSKNPEKKEDCLWNQAKAVTWAFILTAVFVTIYIGRSFYKKSKKEKERLPAY